MRIEDMNWMQVEAYLRADDRAVLPLGCTEQHAYLSLATDTTLAGRVAQEAAAPLGVPVFPALAYGYTPTFRAYPGTLGLRLETFLRATRDLLDGLYEQGFRRILVVNGHGGNIPAQALVGEWLADHAEARVQFHSWWNAPRVWAEVQAIDPRASHASWMENFPWTRLEGITLPQERKDTVDYARLRQLPPGRARNLLGDGNYDGLYERPDEDMLRIWQVAVQETRDLLADGWA